MSNDEKEYILSLWCSNFNLISYVKNIWYPYHATQERAGYTESYKYDLDDFSSFAKYFLKWLHGERGSDMEWLYILCVYSLFIHSVS